MYLMIGTRPDLAAAVGVISRHLDNPTEEHVKAVKRIFRYLKGTTDYCLTYTKSTSLTLTGYVDADWGGCLDTRKSTHGYVFLFNNSAITWKSKLQSVVALSSTEAEYMGACFASKECVWLRYLLAELGVEQTEPTLILTDNQSSIKLMENPVHHDRTKHIDIQYHFTRELLVNGKVDFKFVETEKQVADFLTKGMTKEKQEFCSLACGLIQTR